jgi:hypothetical protein
MSSRNRSNTSPAPQHQPQSPVPEVMEFASPETLPGMVAALSNYEAAEAERRGHAEQLAAEADQAGLELDRIAHRIRELNAEADRLGKLRVDKRVAADERHGAAEAAAAQARDFRRILAQIAPKALAEYDERKRQQAATVTALTGQPPATTTGPQDTRVAAGDYETAAMPVTDPPTRNGA